MFTLIWLFLDLLFQERFYLIVLVRTFLFLELDL